MEFSALQQAPNEFSLMDVFFKNYKMYTANIQPYLK